MSRSSRDRVESRLANVSRIAYVAARLAGVPNRALGAFLADEFKLDLSASSIERAVAPLRASSPYKRRTGPQKHRALDDEVEPPALWDWLLVDEQRLGLSKALVTIKGVGRNQEGLLIWLRDLPGVRQVIETSFDREVLVIVLFRDDEEGASIRSQIEEHTPDRGVTWQEVLREEQLPAAKTWQHIARRAVADLDSDGWNE